MNAPYTLAIPIMNALSTSSTRQAYWGELRRAGAQRVLLCPPRMLGGGRQRLSVLKLLAENLRFYRDMGLEAGVWLDGLGHGAPLTGPESYMAGRYTPIRGLDGSESQDSYCPLDPAFSRDYCAMIRDVAALEPALILIDDDFRLSLRSGHDVGCACSRHLEAFSQRLGESVSRQALAERVFAGGPNRYRDLWLDLMGDTLRRFAQDLRQSVNSVNPAIRLGHCACIPTWDTDGVDSLELARILAGPTRPLLRLIGAPYWAATRSFGMRSPAEPAELERLQLHWCREAAARGYEIFSECDAYPRPRSAVPAAYLEGFEGILRADGLAQGCLKYMLDYHGSPRYETGYVDRHIQYAKRREGLAQLFAGKTAVGLQLFEPMHKLRQAHFEGNALDRVVNSFFPASQRLALGCSVPVSYGDDPLTATLAFGESARHMDAGFARRPLILDAAAAQILQLQGRDIGLVSGAPCSPPVWEHFPGLGERLPVEGADGFFQLQPAPGAEVLSWFEASGQRWPAVYRYTAGSGQRILTFAFDASRMKEGVNGLFCSYCRQRQLGGAVAWLQGRPLAAFCPGNPGLYLMAKQGAGRLAVALWNFSEDEAFAPQVELDRAYTHLRLAPFCGMRAALSGSRVAFEDDLAPFACAAFEVWS